MSWKSLVTTGVLCVAASPVFAAPTLSVELLGLNAAGNWVWRSRIAPTDPIPSGSTALATELGFRETTAAELLGATNLSTGADDDFDTNNPGNVIFGWETLTNLGGGGSCNSATPGMCPVGLQTNAPTDEVFAALGSQVYNTTGPKDFIQLEVSRPTTAQPNTTVQWLGAYSSNGRIAEATGATTSVNYDTYAGSATKGVRGGNANLSPMIDVGDLAILGANWNQMGGQRWQDADFTGEGNTDVGDLAVLGANWNQADANWPTQGMVGGAGAALGNGGVVPEPSTLVLLGLSGLMAFATRRRTC